MHELVVLYAVALPVGHRVEVRWYSQVASRLFGGTSETAREHEPVIVDLRRNFVFQRILPPGDHGVVIGVEGQSQTRDVTIPKRDVFATGIVDVGDRATARVTLAAPQLHRDADDIVPLGREEGGGNGAVDATGHRDEHPRTRRECHRGKLRRRVTAATTAAAARSTSVAVVVWPSVSRNEPWAVDRSTPIAARTWEGC